MVAALIAVMSPATHAAPGSDELREFVAVSGDSKVDLEASMSIGGPAFDPKPHGHRDSPLLAESSAELESDPYQAIVTQGRMLCDAVDEQGNAGACPGAVLDLAEDAEPEPEQEDLAPVDVEAAILSAFRSLPVAPSAIHHQPKGDWTLVNVDFIVYTATTPQVLSTAVLGVPLTFTLTPAHWTWDFGDGSPPVATSSPGAPYPDQTIGHPYTAASDGVSITLTTLWSGSYQINGTGTSWPVQGFVTTTATAGPIEVRTARTRLITVQDR